MSLKYVHTINGHLAGYNGQQICYANKPRKNGWHVKVMNTLKQIKEEQKKSNDYRKRRGFNKTNYGYQIIEVI